MSRKGSENGEDMLLEMECRHTYNLIEETRIETTSGALFQAQDLEFSRTVAVKMVEIQGGNRYEKKQSYEKAYSEVRAMISLSEEHLPIPSIYETWYDENHSRLYIVMDWIKGETLDSHMSEPEMKFIQWMIDLCDILDSMERKHLYHKDIKPSNIMIDKKDRLFLIDFNISISTPNLLEGTVNYKAPEMAANSKYVGREKADMFSIGVILYEFYTGEVPVRGKDYAKNRSRGPLEWDKFISPKEKNEKINDEMNEIIKKCMKLDPKQRYRNYADLRSTLIKARKGIQWAQRKK